MINKIASIGILLFFLLPAYPAFGVKSAAGAPGTKKVLSADKVEIAYTASGSGDTAIIFIHGGFSNRGFWKLQEKAFSKNHRFIALDLAGHGESGDNRKEWGFPAYGRDVCAVMEKEKIKRAVLVGNSLGGSVALEAARLIPKKIIGIVAVDTFQEFIAKMPDDYLKQQAEAFRTDFKGSMKKLYALLFHPDVDKTLREYVEKEMLDNSAEVAIGVFESVIGYDMMEPVKNFKGPIRCINGDLTPTKIEKNRKVHRDFDAVIIPHTGHYPMLEKPEIFNRHLKKILLEMEAEAKTKKH